MRNTEISEHADVVVFRCGDYRTNGIRGLPIQYAVNNIAHNLGFGVGEEHVRYDEQVVPGPSSIFTNPLRGDEIAIMIKQIMIYISKHQPELVIVSAHHDCAAEDKQGRSAEEQRPVSLQNLAMFAMELGVALKAEARKRGHVGKLSIAGIMINVDDDKIIDTPIGYTMRELSAMLNTHQHDEEPHIGAFTEDAVTLRVSPSSL